MDEKGDEVKPGPHISPHVGTKRLIAYREGKLSEAESEAVQEHLSLCPRCTGLLRELRDFEAASAGAVEPGPDSLRQEAWESLVKRLPRQTAPEVRPVASLPAPRRPVPALLYAAAAALLLAVIGLSVWAAVMVRQERRRLAAAEQRLEERESALARARRAVAETGRQLQAARGQLQDLQKEKAPGRPNRETELEARIAELTSSLEELRRTANDRIAASPSKEVDLAVAPRFALRGQEESGFLRAGGAVNRIPRAEHLTAALDLGEHPVYGEYRFELTDPKGQVLWSGRRPAGSLLGDAGTTLSIRGLGPGRYRLRVEGLHPDRTDLLAEYLLEIA